VTVELYKAAATATRDELVAKHAALVRRLASQLLARLPSSVDIDDLIQAGMIGLLDAIGRFEAGHGAQFETFAMQRIRGAMLDELRGNDWVPRSLRKKQREIEAAIRKLESKLHRPPTENEIAQQLEMTLPDYQHSLAESRGAQLIYIDEYDRGDDSGNRFLDQNTEAKPADPLAILREGRFRQNLTESIGALPEREQQVMSMYYEQDMNMCEIGAVLKVTESRVCQLHTQAIARLRVKLANWLGKH
jgi:RNA polymerase sigma factor FliA